MRVYNEKIDSASIMINSPECKSIRESVMDLIDYIKKTGAMRVIRMGESSPELDKLIFIVGEFYSLAYKYEKLKKENENTSEEKEREIFKKYFNQIIDNLLDGNTKGKYD